MGAFGLTNSVVCYCHDIGVPIVAMVNWERGGERVRWTRCYVAMQVRCGEERAEPTIGSSSPALLTTVTRFCLRGHGPGLPLLRFGRGGHICGGAMVLRRKMKCGLQVRGLGDGGALLWFWWTWKLTQHHWRGFEAVETPSISLASWDRLRRTELRKQWSVESIQIVRASCFDSFGNYISHTRGTLFLTQIPSFPFFSPLDSTLYPHNGRARSPRTERTPLRRRPLPR